MKKETLNILNDRLKELNCLHSQPWLRARLITNIKQEWEIINAQALQKLRRVVNLKITHKTIGNEFLSGPPVDFTKNDEINGTIASKTEATAKPTEAKPGSNTEPSTQSSDADQDIFFYWTAEENQKQGLPR
jgi:hypothetical protein